MKHAPNTPYSYIRFFNTINHFSTYTIHLENHLYAKKLFYKQFTHYKSIESGEHCFKITASDNKKDSFSAVITLKPYYVYTLILMLSPKNNEPTLYLYSEEKRRIPEGHLLLRCTSLISTPYIYQIELENTLPRFRKVLPFQSTPYLSFVPGSYTINISQLDATEPLSIKKNQVLNSERYYSLYLLGDMECPTAIIVVDGISFLFA